MNIKKKKKKKRDEQADEPNKPVADNNGIRVRRTRTAFSFIIQALARARAYFFYVVAFKYFMASLAIDDVARAIQANENSFKLWQRVTCVCTCKIQWGEKMKMMETWWRRRRRCNTKAIRFYEGGPNEREYFGEKLLTFKSLNFLFLFPSLTANPVLLSDGNTRARAPLRLAYCTRLYVIKCINTIIMNGRKCFSAYTPARHARWNGIKGENARRTRAFAPWRLIWPTCVSRMANKEEIAKSGDADEGWSAKEPECVEGA